MPFLMSGGVADNLVQMLKQPLRRKRKEYLDVCLQGLGARVSDFHSTARSNWSTI